MNAERLRQIQAALQRDFGTKSGFVQCPDPHHVHLVYAHGAGLVKARTLKLLDHTDFERRVDAWPWPTTTQYEGCRVIKHARPYRDFLHARFVWKELAGVQLGQLPTNVSPPPAATAADGGTILTLTRGTSLDPHATAAPQVTLTLPAQPAPPAGYPNLHRVCLSTPGAEGRHAELAAGATQVTLEYPSQGSDSELHLIGVMPWFRFELRGPRGAVETIDDP